MSKKDRRFITIHKEGSELSSSGYTQLLVDRETGVTYLFIKSGYGAGLTPLLNHDGRPVITYLEP